MGQHRALGAAGGARGVEQRREVVGRALDRREGFRRRVGRVRQAALALGVERDERRARLVGRGLQRLAPGRVADEDRGLGVADEVLDLGRGVAGVERQEDAAGADRAEVEHDRLDRLLDLGGDPVAGLHAEADEGVGHPAGAGDEVGVGDALAGGGLDRGGGGVGDVVREEGEEIGVHGVHRMRGVRTRRRGRQGRAHRVGGGDPALLGQRLVVLLDLAEVVEVVDHQPVRLAQPVRRDVAEEVQPLEPRAVAEVEARHRVDRAAGLVLRLQEVVGRDRDQHGAHGLRLLRVEVPAGLVEQRERRAPPRRRGSPTRRPPARASARRRSPAPARG